MSYSGHYWTPATRDGQLQAPPARDTGWWYCIQCGSFGTGEGGFCSKYGDLERSERDIAWRQKVELQLREWLRLMADAETPDEVAWVVASLCDRIRAVLAGGEEFALLVRKLAAADRAVLTEGKE